MNQKKFSLRKNERSLRDEIVLIILIAGIFVGVLLVQQRTFFLPKAQEEVPIVFERPTPTPEPDIFTQAKQIKLTVEELFTGAFNSLIDQIKHIRI